MDNYGNNETYQTSHRENNSFATTLDDVKIGMLHHDDASNDDLSGKPENYLKIHSISGTSNIEDSADSTYGK